MSTSGRSPCSASAPETEIERHWPGTLEIPSGVGPIEDELHRRVDRRGERQSITLRSNTRWTSMIGDVPRTERRSPNATSSGSRSAAAASGGTASTNASESMRSPSTTSAGGRTGRRHGRPRSPRPWRGGARRRRPLLERWRAGVAVQLAERDAGPSDVGGIGLLEEARLEDLGGEREGDLVAPEIGRRQHDEIEEHPDGVLALAVAAQEAPETLAVERRVAERERPQRTEHPAEPQSLVPSERWR